jgi:hypothetical protein
MIMATDQRIPNAAGATGRVARHTRFGEDGNHTKVRSNCHESPAQPILLTKSSAAQERKKP